MAYQGMFQTIYLKMHPLSYVNTQHDVTDLDILLMFRNTKYWIPSKRNLTFLWNKKNLNIRNYCFVAVVTSKSLFFIVCYLFKFSIRFSWIYSIVLLPICINAITDVLSITQYQPNCTVCHTIDWFLWCN